jgi:serine/threonine protein kinase
MSLQLRASGAFTRNGARSDVPPQVEEVSEGQVLLGKFRVERVLGVGGMGAVVAAHHLQLDTRVAIKFLLQSTLRNGEAVSRFSREARAAARITSEHVARVFDVGTLDSGAPYMVMEYLDGFDLGTWLERKGPLDCEDAVEFVLQACEAVAEAHALGIVHRDLKPSNLFCIRRADQRWVIKVLDFGISRIASLGLPPQDMRVTSDVLLMGTPLYMSPEHIAGSPAVDARTDIWALGVILYELVTGKMPFSGETLPQVWAQITTQAPPSLRQSIPFLPDGLEAAIFRCLEKDRRERYRNVAELASALQLFGPERSGTSVRRISEIIRGAGLSVEPLRSAEPLPALPERAGAEITVRKVRTTPIVETTQTMAEATRTAARADKVVRSIVAALGGLAAAAVIAFFLLARTRQVATAAPAFGPGIAAPSLSSPNEPSPEAPAATLGALANGAIASPSANTEPHAPKADRAALLAPRGTRRTLVTAKLAATVTPTAPTATVASATGTGAAVAKPDCSTTFTRDDQGRKHFKPECSAALAALPTHPSASAAACDPSFYFDDQGRKHFTPDCFLNVK